MEATTDQPQAPRHAGRPNSDAVRGPQAQGSTLRSDRPQRDYYRRVAQWGVQTAEALEHDLRAEIATAGNRADQASAEAQAALERADALARADEARKARGRLRRAWDGWRGR